MKLLFNNIAIASFFQTVLTQSSNTEAPVNYPGQDCKNNADVCRSSNEVCIEWLDTNGISTKFSCQDCNNSQRYLLDEYMKEIRFYCPGELETANKLIGVAGTVIFAIITTLM